MWPVSSTATIRHPLLSSSPTFRHSSEPDTLGYFVSRGVSENGRAVFTTYERYASGAALEQHNGSAAVARFFDVAAPLLSEPATVVVAEELAAMEITAERSGRFHSNNQSGR